MAYDDLLRLVAHAESGNRDYDAAGRVVTSPVGAKGRMQVMDATNLDPGYGVRPAQNDSLEERARVGRDYLAAMVNNYGGDVRKGLAAYNAGPGNVDRALKRAQAAGDSDWMKYLPKPEETVPYVNKIVAGLSPQPTPLDNAAAAVMPSAQAASADDIDWDSVEWEEPAQAASDDVDWDSVQWDDEPEQEAVSENPVVALGAGLGAGVGQVAMGAQEWLGKGLRGVGADSLGNWLVEDAEKGRAKLAGELAPYKEASPISSTVGEIGGNIAAVAPPLRAAGAVLGLGGRLIPGLGALGQSVASAGLRSGGLAGARGLAARTAGGAISGGVSAGLVDPEAAGEGALIGGALPGVWGGSAKAMSGAAKLIRGEGAAIPAGVSQAAQAARAAGYTLPPTQVRPTLVNRLLEGTAGKITTAQQASARNQEVTNRLTREALGVAPGTEISADLLKTLRQQAGKSYQNLRSIGTIQADDAFNAALDSIEKSYQGAGRSFPGLADTGVTDLVASLRQQAFDAGDALDAIAVLREKADAAYRAGNGTVGKASRKAADALEDVVERAAAASGDPKAVEQMRSARQLIAKTYTVNKALNPTTGNVDARAIARELKKGKPLSGELRQIGETAAAFPKATQTVEGIGSQPGMSPLDVVNSSILTAVTQNPLAAMAILGRPAARSIALSSPIQNRLAAALAERQASPMLSGAQNRLAEFAFRSAPLLSTSR